MNIQVIIYGFILGKAPNIMIDRRVIRGNTYSAFRNQINKFGSNKQVIFNIKLFKLSVRPSVTQRGKRDFLGCKEE